MDENWSASATADYSSSARPRELAGTATYVSSNPLYSVWTGMHQRCRDPKGRNAHLYYARGITVCERWSGPDGFPNFLADMGENP